MTVIAPRAVFPTADKPVSSRRPDVGESGFAVSATSSASGGPSSPPASGMPAMSAAAAMLALQEHVGPGSATEAALADREARKHAQDILQALATLQRELLAGGRPNESLSRLTALAQAMPVAHDPALARIVNSIRLRAQLEALRLTPRSP